MIMLSGKVAIVSGASSGIGKATAHLFAARGAKVVLAARREPELNETARSIADAGGIAVVLSGDVRDETYARALVDLAVERFGGLDVAFNNAGTLGSMGPVHQLETGEWEDTLRTNLTSAFLASKYQVPALRERGGGALVFTSSFVGTTVGFPGMAAYAASKAGLLGFTRTLAAELGAFRIRVNALLPGGTDTPMGRTVASSDDALRAVRALHALGRLASPDEIAQSALYLASDASSFTTGAALFADGGVSIYRG